LPYVYYLTSELRREFKKPIGKLIRGSFEETMRKLKEIVNLEKPTKIIAVGDRVSMNLWKNGFSPQLSIVDNKVMRKNINITGIMADKTVYVKNPPGTLTEEAMLKVREALGKNFRIKMVVEGEEDLFTLPAVLYAPESSFVIYGQPYEGIVIVKVTKEKKDEAANVLKRMRKVSKS